MHPRHRLDISLADVAFGLRSCAVRPAGPVEAAVLDAVGLTGQGLVALSVRSAWDLLLTTLDWPVGDEILVSAITHPDMIMIIEAHGLRAVPVDLDPDTLAPSVVDLAGLVGGRTRAIMVVHLFGGRIDLSPIRAFADDHDLLLIEDSAQAFTGPGSLRAAGQVALYSFGMIKTASAGGGAIMVVPDAELLGALQRQHHSWPQQTRRSYAARLTKIIGLLLLSRPAIYAAFFRVCERLGHDPDGVINSASRSFASTDVDHDLLSHLRRRPALALVAVLSRRLRGFDPRRMTARAALGERVAASLPAAVRHPGDGLTERTHWLFPVLAPDPDALVVELRRRGLDPSQGTSNLVAVGGHDGRVPERAGRLMGSIVYLPVYPELPAGAVGDLVDGLHDGVSAPAGRRAG